MPESIYYNKTLFWAYFKIIKMNCLWKFKSRVSLKHHLATDYQYQNLKFLFKKKIKTRKNKEN